MPLPEHARVENATWICDEFLLAFAGKYYAVAL